MLPNQEIQSRPRYILEATMTFISIKHENFVESSNGHQRALSGGSAAKLKEAEVPLIFEEKTARRSHQKSSYCDLVGTTIEETVDVNRKGEFR